MMRQTQIHKALLKFYAWQKNDAHSVVYALKGSGADYHFGNTFLTESKLHQCIYDLFYKLIQQGFRGFMSVIRQPAFQSLMNRASARRVAAV